VEAVSLAVDMHSGTDRQTAAGRQQTAGSRQQTVGNKQQKAESRQRGVPTGVAQTPERAEDRLEVLAFTEKVECILSNDKSNIILETFVKNNSKLCNWVRQQSTHPIAAGREFTRRMTASFS
jgi:hypothetical protein